MNLRYDALQDSTPVETQKPTLVVIDLDETIFGNTTQLVLDLYAERTQTPRHLREELVAAGSLQALLGITNDPVKGTADDQEMALYRDVYRDMQSKIISLADPELLAALSNDSRFKVVFATTVTEPWRAEMGPIMTGMFTERYPGIEFNLVMTGGSGEKVKMLGENDVWIDNAGSAIAKVLALGETTKTLYAIDDPASTKDLIKAAGNRAVVPVKDVNQAITMEYERQRLQVPTRNATARTGKSTR